MKHSMVFGKADHASQPYSIPSYDMILQNNITCPETGTDAINLDFSKAFDKVDHGVLLHKLLDLKLKGEVGSWIAEFLSRPRQFVRVHGHESTTSDVISSVPQGTVLGLAFFLILMLILLPGSKVISSAYKTTQSYTIRPR